jgi:type II restriction enzyme
MIPSDQRTVIKDILIKSIRNKFQNHNPEPSYMPFHTRLLGKDRLALYQFIHSLNTNFGTTIFEPVALALAAKKFKVALSQQTAGTRISSEAHKVIQDIMDSLSTAECNPNKEQEIERIRRACQSGGMHSVKLTKVDIKLVSIDDEMFLFDLKTAKPNAGGFKEFKRTLLEWVAATLSAEPDANIQTLIAIPYNPYEPKPYARWTMRGMIDLDKELKVAETFWDFIGGAGAYNDLLDCFEQVGIELRDEIDTFFSNFNGK